MGDKLEVSKDMDSYVRCEPLGFGAAVPPFNFPAMIPLWNMVSIAAGNTPIIKPSERGPEATMITAELCECPGLPPGVLSVMHGSKDSFVKLALYANKSDFRLALTSYATIS